MSLCMSLACPCEQSHWHSSSRVSRSQGRHCHAESCNAVVVAIMPKLLQQSTGNVQQWFAQPVYLLQLQSACIVHCSSKHLCSDPSIACAISSMTVIHLACMTYVCNNGCVQKCRAACVHVLHFGARLLYVTGCYDCMSEQHT